MTSEARLGAPKVRCAVSTTRLLVSGPALLSQCVAAAPSQRVAVTYRDSRQAAWPYSGMMGVDERGADTLLAYEVAAPLPSSRRPPLRIAPSSNLGRHLDSARPRSLAIMSPDCVRRTPSAQVPVARDFGYGDGHHYSALVKQGSVYREDCAIPRQPRRALGQQGAGEQPRDARHPATLRHALQALGRR